MRFLKKICNIMVIISFLQIFIIPFLIFTIGSIIEALLSSLFNIKNVSSSLNIFISIILIMMPGIKCYIYYAFSKIIEKSIFIDENQKELEEIIILYKNNKMKQENSKVLNFEYVKEQIKNEPTDIQIAILKKFISDREKESKQL